MRCKKAQKSFDELCRQGDQQIDPAVLDHIAKCGRCSQKLAQWHDIIHYLNVKSQVVVPERLEEQVLAYVAVRSQQRKATSWLGLAQPIWASALAACVMAAAVLLIPQFAGNTGKNVQNSASHSVTFALNAPQAQQVVVAGDFNRWNAGECKLSRASDGRWTITLALQPGAYQYQFIVDGRQWMADPDNPITVPDGYGGYNSEIEL
jgi:hypothetical protein